MNRLIQIPNLPQSRVTHMVASGENGRLCAALRGRGVVLLHPDRSALLPPPVACHADMLFHHLGGQFAAAEHSQKELKARLLALGFFVDDGFVAGAAYPQDIGLNACALGRKLICRPSHTYPPLLRGRQTLPTRQGYAKCAAAVVTENAIITEDASIARAAEAGGVDVLLIRKGAVRLDGYPYGFIGGCCGKLSRGQLVFCGDVTRHPDYERIRAFTERHGVQCEPLTDGELTDVGSLLPICEEAADLDSRLHSHYNNESNLK